MMMMMMRGGNIPIGVLFWACIALQLLLLFPSKNPLFAHTSLWLNPKVLAMDELVVVLAASSKRTRNEILWPSSNDCDDDDDDSSERNNIVFQSRRRSHQHNNCNECPWRRRKYSSWTIACQLRLRGGDNKDDDHVHIDLSNKDAHVVRPSLQHPYRRRKRRRKKKESGGTVGDTKNVDVHHESVMGILSAESSLNGIMGTNNGTADQGDTNELGLTGVKGKRRKRMRTKKKFVAVSTDNDELCTHLDLTIQSQDEQIAMATVKTSINGRAQRRQRRRLANIDVSTRTISLTSETDDDNASWNEHKERGVSANGDTLTLVHHGDKSIDEIMVSTISKNADIDITPEEREFVEVLSIQSESLSAKKQRASETNDDMSSFLSIDASISIPSEEIIPESVNACIEMKDVSILPSVATIEDTSTSIDTIIVPHSESNDSIIEPPTESSVQESTECSVDNIHNDDTAKLDIVEHQITSHEIDGSHPDGMSLPHLIDDSEPDVDMLVTIPREEAEHQHTILDRKESGDDNDNYGAYMKDGLDSHHHDSFSSNTEPIPRNVSEIEREIQSVEAYKTFDITSNVDGISVHDFPKDDSLSTTASEGGVEPSYSSVETQKQNDKTDSCLESFDHTITDRETIIDDQLSSTTIHSEIETDHVISDDADKTIDNSVDGDCTTVSIVTWNLGETSPSERDFSFLKKFRKDSAGVGSDLVLIGAQECEDIKPRRTEGRRSRHLRRMGIMMLGKEYVPLAIHSLGGIQCALYCHRDVLGDVEMVSLADVTCGVGNVFHNKGAIGVYLKMKRCDTDHTKSSRILFITGHLAAHVNNVDARNSDFRRIISELESQAPSRFLRPKRDEVGSLLECDGTNLLESMDHIFFAGDLNYRVDLPREYVERCITDIQKSTVDDDRFALINKLLRRDQLLQAVASGQAFSGFNEGAIAFLPTFKFDKGTSNYDTSHKQRVPSWTDRIVFRSNNVRVLDYKSIIDARHSDHRPVIGTFQLGWGVRKKLFKRQPKRRVRRTKKRSGII